MAHGEPFYQKRAPKQRPDWIETVELRFPSGRTAEEVVIRDAAQLLWVVNLGCIDLNPHPVRADDLDHPDELRVDLDPGPGVAWDDVRRVTLVVCDVLDDHGLRGWPKTSGSRGMHINVRIERRWSFSQVRRAALALAREVERRVPELATSKWWKEKRPASSSTTTRTPRTARRRLPGQCVHARRASRCRSAGMGSPTATQRRSRVTAPPLAERGDATGRH
jgi:DNA primase